MMRILKQIGGTIGLIGMIGFGIYKFEDSISQVKDGWAIAVIGVVIMIIIIMVIINILRN